MDYFRPSSMIFIKVNFTKILYLDFRILGKMALTLGRPFIRKLFVSKKAAEPYGRNILGLNFQKVIWFHFKNLLGPLAIKFSGFGAYWDICDKVFRMVELLPQSFQDFRPTGWDPCDKDFLAYRHWWPTHWLPRTNVLGSWSLVLGKTC